ncbi:MAG: exodeoxyribonuclease III [Candidatus Accumulibacter sp.]|jgi:exodeoxyribonuclease-3|nr:exodeoxyribonuclease III [Accumulibacter sp.]
MLRIITANLNGIRSAWNKGFFAWATRQNADVVCLQEIKAQWPDLSEEMKAPHGFHAYYHCAMKKGYAGVGLWCRRKPDAITEGIGHAEFDAEGRYLRADFDDLSVISVYVPSGSSSPERQAAKFRFLDAFYPHLVELAHSGRRVVICADWNIAHREIDLRNWKSNQKNSGFLPEERAWIDRVLNDAGWVDVYRHLHPEATDACYTWWSNRGQARAKNVGWRLDYQLATPDLAATACTTAVYKEQRFSDHAPLTIDYSQGRKNQNQNLEGRCPGRNTPAGE